MTKRRVFIAVTVFLFAYILFRPAFSWCEGRGNFSSCHTGFRFALPLYNGSSSLDAAQPIPVCGYPLECWCTNGGSCYAGWKKTTTDEKVFTPGLPVEVPWYRRLL